MTSGRIMESFTELAIVINEIMVKKQPYPQYLSNSVKCKLCNNLQAVRSRLSIPLTALTRFCGYGLAPHRHGQDHSEGKDRGRRPPLCARISARESAHRN